jgi:CelD/BcsL family acetyltransferase involved in cellulose biosynthesis
VRDHRVPEVPDLQVSKLDSWERLESLRAGWEQILQHTPGLTIFSTAEWLGAWWKAFGQGKRLVAASFSNAAGELVGLAPFYREEKTRRGPLGGLRRLLLVGDGTHDSDNMDLIFRSGYEIACSRALLAWLDSEQGWDFCELNRLPAASSIVGAVQSSLQQRKWINIESVRENSVVHLPDSWEAYLRQLPRKFARGIERDTQKLTSSYQVRIFKCAKEDELSPCLETLFALHQKRWHSKGQMGAFAGPERRRFYYEMAGSFLRRGWLELWLLELNGKAAAAQFSFRYGNTVYHLQEGVDPEHLSDRPGVALRVHILKQLILEGVRRYDFLAGIDAHKQLWRALPGTYRQLHFAKRISLGALHLAMSEKVRLGEAWLRANLPPAALSAVRRIYRAVRGQARL